jgi:tetratricopeptide (TPR) repeat protein
MQGAIPVARILLPSALGALALGYLQAGRPKDAVDASTEAINLFRSAGSTIATMRMALASALTVQSQGLCQSGRATDAVPAAKEAADLLGSLDMANPQVCSGLADALNALGQAHSQLGQGEDAIAAFKDSLGIYRDLSRSNPKAVPALAQVLVQFDNLCRLAGRGDEIDVQWQASLAAVDRPEDKTSLLAVRAQTRGPQDISAVEDLLQAQFYLTMSGKSGTLAADLHQTCRSVRAQNPGAFDAAWQSGGGGELRAWLTLDQVCFNTISEWLTMDPLEAQKEFLAKHIASLNPGFDSVAFDEFALRLSDYSGGDAVRVARELQLSRECLSTARELGIEAAYRPVFANRLLIDWMSQDGAAETLAMLKDRRKDLLDDEVEKALRSLLEQSPQDSQLIVHQAVLDLARAGKEDSAFELMGKPDRASAALLDLARSGNADALYPLATILRFTEATDETKALPCFYKAVALAIKGEPDSALQTIEEARRLDPTREKAWLALLFQCGGPRDNLVPLSEALNSPQIPKAADA